MTDNVINKSESFRQPKSRWTEIECPMVEDGIVRIDKNKICTINKNSQIIQKQMPSVLVNQPGESQTMELFLIVVNGIPIPFIDKSTRDNVFDYLIK